MNKSGKLKIFKIYIYCVLIYIIGFSGFILIDDYNLISQNWKEYKWEQFLFYLGWILAYLIPFSLIFWSGYYLNRLVKIKL